MSTRRHHRLVPRNGDWTDGFCGAGGSSIGIREAGFELKVAANHWSLAIETHSANFPDAEHICADLSVFDMRKLPHTDFAWFSPECTWQSPAGGRRKRRAQLDMFDEYVPNDAGDRSRMTMFDVVHAAEIHRYLALIIENVIEVADWELFDVFIAALRRLGYTVQLVSVNSAHVWSDDNAPAPQWRDRLYIVCTLEGLPLPDVTPRPLARCESCQCDVTAVQVFKKDRRLGKYRQQYDYVCPHGHGALEPYVLPALAAIDWTDIGQRIGDRTRPLAAATERRIRTGAYLFAEPLSVMVGGNTWERPGSGYARCWPISDPLVARTKTPGDALACPPMLVPAGGTWNDVAGSAEEPMRTRTTRATDAVVTAPFLVNSNHDDDRIYRADSRPLPTRTVKIGEGVAVPPFVTMLRAHNRPMSVSEPLATLSTGRHHGLTVPPGAFIQKHHGGLDYAGVEHMVKSVIDPLAAVVAKPNLSLVIPYNRTGRARRAMEPLTTVTTRDRHGLLTRPDISAIDISDFHFRMLQPREHGRAQRFPDSYVVRGNKGEQTMQFGNAVSSNVACWLVTAVMRIFDPDPLTAEEASA